MCAVVEPDANGNVKWRDLDAREARIIESLDKRLERAHVYANERLDATYDEVRSNGKRIDALESVIDQQRGARNLMFVLIGSNMLLVIIAVITLLFPATIP